MTLVNCLHCFVSTPSSVVYEVKLFKNVINRKVTKTKSGFDFHC